MNRRTFAKWFSATPLLAALGIPNVVVEPAVPHPALDNAFKPRTLRHTPPPGLDNYYKAIRDKNDKLKYIRMLTEVKGSVHHTGFPLDIDCLRSVSAVHKHHMIVQREFKRQQENRSFTEKLMDQFGVRSWFDKMNGENGPQAAESGYYG